MSTPSDDRPPIRIGTSEREAAYAALNAHLDAGRLDPDEYGERYGRASVARTRPELEALFVDLPAPHPALDPPAAAPSWATGAPAPRGHGPRAFRIVPAAFALLPIIAIVAAFTTGLWFLVFAIPVGASILGRRFGGHGRGYGRPYGHCGPHRARQYG
jgi:Domain of unknown function (DUF1707)